MIERLIDQYYEWIGGPLGYLPINGVAMHPVTHYQAISEYYDSPDSLHLGPDEYGQRFMGVRVVKSTNVEQGQLRIIPAGRLNYYRNERGVPCPWPHPSIRLGKTTLGHVAFVDEAGEYIPAVRLDALSEQ